MKRWDDEHTNLRDRLDALKHMDEKTRDPIIKGVMNLMQQYDPELLCSEKAVDFPLDLQKRRWYDADPYLWTMFNTLKAADDTLLQSVEAYLGSKIKCSE